MGYDEPFFIQKKRPDQLVEAFGIKLDDDLLSHGETPHYHRRSAVSLLSSVWGQVVPILYGRQANWLAIRSIFILNHPIRCSDTKGVNVFMSFVVFYKTVIHLLVYALDNQVRLSNRILLLLIS